MPDPRIVLDPLVLAGKPVIRGTRLSVEFVVGLLAQGWRNEDVMRQYPGVTEDDILQGRSGDAFRRLMEFQVGRARATYAQALAQLPACDRKAQRAGLVMAAIYRATLDAIERSGCPVLDRHVSLSAPHKLWLAAKTWLRA